MVIGHVHDQRVGYREAFGAARDAAKEVIDDNDVGVVRGDLGRDRIRKRLAKKKFAGESGLVLEGTTQPRVELQPPREGSRHATGGGGASCENRGGHDPNPVAALDEEPAETDCGLAGPTPAPGGDQHIELRSGSGHSSSPRRSGRTMVK